MNTRRTISCISTAVLGGAMLLALAIQPAAQATPVAAEAPVTGTLPHALSPAQAQALTGTVTVTPAGVTCSNAGPLHGYFSNALFADTQAGQQDGAALLALKSITNYCLYSVNGITEIVQYGTAYCLSYQNAYPHTLLGYGCRGNAQWQNWTIDVIGGDPYVFTVDNNYSGTLATLWNFLGVVQMQSWNWLGGNSWENQEFVGL